jgi:hypothetical protein
MSESNTSVGFSFEFVLFVVFLVLKLTGTIDWSWWWVTAPLWGGCILLLIIIGVLLYVFR